MTNDSSPNDSRLRLRAVLDAQFVLLMAVLLVVAAAGAGLTHAAYVDPDVETDERTVDTWSVESEHVHAATVTEPNSVFPVGAELTDRDTYFARIAPELDVDVVTRYDASSAESVSIDVESVLVVTNAEDGTVYWEETETLAAASATAVDPGENVTASFTLNASEVDERVSEIESELGSSPGTTETVVRTDVSLDGTVNGQAVEHDRSLEFGLSSGGDTYTVDDPGLQSDTIERTETVETTREYSPLYTAGGPLLLVVGLAGAGALAYGRREDRFALSDRERAYLDFRDDRSEFGEWITRIRLPEGAYGRPEATAESLADLVEFAIDNDAGVVEDPRTGVYHAVVDGTLYTYTPPATPPSLAGGTDGETGRDGAESLAAAATAADDGEAFDYDRYGDEGTGSEGTGGDGTGGDGTGGDGIGDEQASDGETVTEGAVAAEKGGSEDGRSSRQP